MYNVSDDPLELQNLYNDPNPYFPSKISWRRFSSSSAARSD